MSKFNDIVEAWDYLIKTTYFARPYKNNEGEIFSFGNEFQYNLHIAYVKLNPRTMKIDDDESLNTKPVVWLECGSFCLEHDSFYWDYTLNTQADTFQEAIIKLANTVFDRAGNDMADDYFVIDEDSKIDWKDLENGHKQLLNAVDKSCWKTEELLERIRHYEKVSNS